MQLNELFEKHSIGIISERTMISEDNIERIVAEDYASLSKAKALGFLSILEREYQLDVKNIRKNIAAYYDTIENDDEIVNLTHPRVEEKKGRSKWFFFLMLALLAYASWYFFTQFDNKNLKTLMPFADDNGSTPLLEENKTFEIANLVVEDKDEEAKEVVQNNLTDTYKVNTPTKVDDSLVLSTALSNSEQDTAGVETNIVVMDIEPNDSSKSNTNTTVVNTELVTEENVVIASNEENTTVDENASKSTSDEANQSTQIEEIVEVTKVILTPVKRLWFGLVNMRTGKRDHFSVRKPFTIDLTKGDWLVATSPAPFSLKFKDEIENYNNGREHYFIITKEGISKLKKRAYVRKGGYRKW
jgi:hypothetical protein